MRFNLKQKRKRAREPEKRVGRGGGGRRRDINIPEQLKTVIQTYENVPDSLMISRKLLEKPTVIEGENCS